MANEISYELGATGSNVYAVVRNQAGQAWDGSSFVTYTTTRDDFDLALTEVGSTGFYGPINCPGSGMGRWWQIYLRVGDSPSHTNDVLLAEDHLGLIWDNIVTATEEALSVYGGDGAATAMGVESILEQIGPAVSHLGADGLAGGVVEIQDHIGGTTFGSITEDLEALDSLIDDIKAKTDNLPDSPAAVGSEMALSSDARAAVVADTEAALVNEGDATALLQAIADKLATDFDLGELSSTTIASAVWNWELSESPMYGWIADIWEYLGIADEGSAAEALSALKEKINTLLDGVNLTKWKGTEPGNLDGNGFVPSNMAAINGNTTRADTFATAMDNNRLDASISSRASQTTANDIETDTQNIQSRIPASLDSGRMVAALDNITAGSAATTALLAFLTGNGLGPVIWRSNNITQVDSTTAFTIAGGGDFAAPWDGCTIVFTYLESQGQRQVNRILISQDNGGNVDILLAKPNANLVAGTGILVEVLAPGYHPDDRLALTTANAGIVEISEGVDELLEAGFGSESGGGGGGDCYLFKGVTDNIVTGSPPTPTTLLFEDTPFIDCAGCIAVIKRQTGDTHVRYILSSGHGSGNFGIQVVSVDAEIGDTVEIYPMAAPAVPANFDKLAINEEGVVNAVVGNVDISYEIGIYNPHDNEFETQANLSKVFIGDTITFYGTHTGGARAEKHVITDVNRIEGIITIRDGSFFLDNYDDIVEPVIKVYPTPKIVQSDLWTIRGMPEPVINMQWHFDGSGYGSLLFREFINDAILGSGQPTIIMFERPYSDVTGCLAVIRHPSTGIIYGVREVSEAIDFSGNLNIKVDEINVIPGYIVDLIAFAPTTGGTGLIAQIHEKTSQLTFTTPNRVDATSSITGGGASGGGTLNARIADSSLAPDNFLKVVQGESKVITFIVEANGRFANDIATDISVKFRDTTKQVVEIGNANVQRICEELDVQVIRVTLLPEHTALLKSGMLRIEITFDEQKAVLTHSMKVLEAI